MPSHPAEPVIARQTLTTEYRDDEVADEIADDVVIAEECESPELTGKYGGYGGLLTTEEE